MSSKYEKEEETSIWKDWAREVMREHFPSAVRLLERDRKDELDVV